MKIKLSLIIAVMTLLLAPACASPAPPPPDTSCNPPGYTYIDYSDGKSTVPMDGVFRLDRVIWGPFSLYVFGSADLPEETTIRVQLYEGENPLEWWPVNYDLRVHDNKWEFSVKASEYQDIEELPAPGKDYSLHIRGRFKPDITGQLPLIPPDRTFKTYEIATDGKAASLDGTQWRLVFLKDRELIDYTEISLEFKDGKATGSSGCNYYGGNYLTRAPYLLNITDMTVTLMGCSEPILEQEQVYIRYLDRAICYRVDENELSLYDVITRERSMIFERQGQQE
jgi:heat shock protein HslJ